MTFTALLIRFARDRKAATAVEYGFILAMIAMAIMAALLALGTTTSTMWNNISSKVASVTGG